MKRLFYRSYNWLLNFTQLQLFITIASLPILIAWGLPISMVSPLANLLFGPLLTIFLFLASLVFFLELFGIPNQPIIWLLEQTTDCWLSIMKQGNPSWLIYCKKPVIIVLFIPIISCCILLRYYKPRTNERTAAIFAFILISTLALLKMVAGQSNYYEIIKAPRGYMILMSKEGNIILKDRGALSGTNAVDSWIDYTLFPTMTKAFGSIKINEIVLQRANKTTVKAWQHLCSMTTINKVKLPKHTIDNQYINQIKETSKEFKILFE